MVRVGILGTGFGLNHLKSYQQSERASVVQVFGRNTEKLATIGTEHGVDVTNDPMEIIENEQVDLVDVCLPTAMHKEYVEEALSHGKHVFCETPVSSSVADAESMKECARKHGRQLLVDLFMKYSQPHRDVLDLIRAGGLGNVVMATAVQMSPPHWGDMSAAKLVSDFMIHNLDFLTEALGVPERVSARAAESTNAFVTSHLTYGNAEAIAQATFMLPKSHPFVLGFQLICENGTVVYEGRFGESTEQRFVLYRDDAFEELGLQERNEHTEVVGRVLDCVDTGAEIPELSIDAAIKSLKVVEATQESIRAGHAVTL
jgi:predicted dehydrogenase